MLGQHRRLLLGFLAYSNKVWVGHFHRSWQITIYLSRGNRHRCLESPTCSDLDPTKRHNGVPDDGIVSCVTALGCLRSPPISSIIADVKNAKSNQGQHRCLPKATVPSAGPATSTALDDLIHLPGPLTEDAVLKCLQARFCAKQYHVRLTLSIETDQWPKVPETQEIPNLNVLK